MQIREFEALSMGGTNWSAAFAAAIEVLEKQGGGVLTVSPGVYPTGSIQLCGNMTLEVQSGAELRFLMDEAAFPLIDLEFEGCTGKAHRPCLFARNAEHIIVTGGGTLNGQGDYWWPKALSHQLDAPRPYLVCFADCTDVVLENLRLINSPVWTVHPLRCNHVTVRGIHIKNPASSPNTDGINPNACRDVRIHDCTIDVGDDCIAIKSGTEDTPNRRACERIVISNCHFLHGHGGIVLGSEMSGGVRNVLVSGCMFYETDRGIRLKTRRGRGGAVENIQLSNLLMEKVMCPFVFNMYYFCGQSGKMKRVWDKNPYPVDETTPALRDVSIMNVTARRCGACAGFFYGLAEMPVERVTLRNVLVEMDENGQSGTPAMMNDCPTMQAQGFFLRNAVDVALDGVRVIGLKGELIDADDSVKLI